MLPAAAKPAREDASVDLAETVPLFRTCGLLIVMVPAGPPGRESLPCEASAVMRPVLMTLVEAVSTTCPPCCARPLAEILPPLLTTALCSVVAALAAMMMMPPGALTARRLLTSVSIVAPVTMTLRKKPLLENWSWYCSPAARTTVPKFATMIPLFWTLGASKAT